jgi:type IX secretion system PorP/SprF family membrane protein
MKFRFYAIIALLSATVALNAQDLHFSQFYAMPLTLNPALTGNFNGLYRISLIYRNQFPTLTSDGKTVYSTPGGSVDFSLLREKLKHSALGVGLVFVNDQQDGKTITSNEIMASVAYNMLFGRKSEFQLGAGLQGGVMLTKLDPTQLMFNDGFYTMQGATGPDILYNTSYNGEALSTKQQTKGLLNVGIFTKYDFAKGMRFYVGYSFNNATHYTQSYIMNESAAYNTPFRHILHGGFEFDVNDKWQLLPGAYMQHSQADGQMTEFGLTAGYNIIRSPVAEKRATLFFGLWDRINNEDAIIPKLGFQYRGFKAGLAYDVYLQHMGDDSHNFGGGFAQAFEITLNFIGDLKIPKEDHYLFNPLY